MLVALHSPGPPSRPADEDRDAAARTAPGLLPTMRAGHHLQPRLTNDHALTCGFTMGREYPWYADETVINVRSRIFRTPSSPTHHRRLLP